ncbi:Rad52/Rad22 family DNA repair protein [Turneriella parva]|uniref:Rad52/22 double-strand break repair protein n=1 Tax=Turneriella parva (strain ATCC BAA-1111 / DSM 21527 / NCTC 11395 / H) TaxID=869212 RepID=I4BAB1_TURPD|nr:Rad52/Rad22 family DNA repair protein [Turneriella parva]AFM14218.1 Rad52/22 double-strand break repair protein [Turneriella parva DSM 21527]
MENNIKEMLQRLAAPFPESAVKWRAALSGINGKGDAYVLAVPYIDARAIQDRLDQVVGAENWMAEYRQGANNGTMCKLSLRINGQFVSKEDGADISEIEPIKGGISNSFRRAAVVWGIGRYLYKLNQMYGTVTDNGLYKGSAKDRTNGQWLNFRWNPPKLPPFAIPEPNLKVLNGEKAVAAQKEPTKPAVRTASAPVAPIKSEITMADVPASLRDLFAELQISDAKALDLLKRKAYNYSEVERILQGIRVDSVAAGA